MRIMIRIQNYSKHQCNGKVISESENETRFCYSIIDDREQPIASKESSTGTATLYKGKQYDLLLNINNTSILKGYT